MSALSQARRSIKVQRGVADLYAHKNERIMEVTCGSMCFLMSFIDCGRDDEGDRVRIVVYAVDPGTRLTVHVPEDIQVTIGNKPAKV